MDTNYCCKVGRITAKYDLAEHILADEIDTILTKKWLGKGIHPNTALRPLTDWFNQKLLRSVYTEYNRKAIEPQLQAEYEALVGDDEDRRQLIFEDLEQDGIDAATLEADLISTSSLYRHLTQCLAVNKETKRGNSDTEWEKDKIEYAKQMSTDRITEVLQSWENKGELPNASEAVVSVDIYVECPICAKRSSVRQAHNRGYICEEHLASDETQQN